MAYIPLLSAVASFIIDNLHPKITNWIERYINSKHNYNYSEIDVLPIDGKDISYIDGQIQQDICVNELHWVTYPKITDWIERNINSKHNYNYSEINVLPIDGKDIDYIDGQIQQDICVNELHGVSLWMDPKITNWIERYINSKHNYN